MEKHPADRLDQKIIAAALDALQQLLLVRDRGDEHNRYEGIMIVALDPCRSLHAIHIGHHHIHQHQVRLDLQTDLTRLTPTLRFEQTKIGIFQHAADDQPINGVVINNQHQRGIKGPW